MGKIKGGNLQTLILWLNQRNMLQRDIQKYIHSEKRKRALTIYKPLCYDIVSYHKKYIIF